MSELRNVTGILRICAVAGWSWILAGCSGIVPGTVPPSSLQPAIDHPADHRIFFQAEDRKHVVTLLDDGSYLFKSGTDFEGVDATRHGRWSWNKTGSHTAELMLDQDVWALTFAGYASAFAVNQAAPGRTYVFQFEKLSGGLRTGLGNG